MTIVREEVLTVGPSGKLPRKETARLFNRQPKTLAAWASAKPRRGPTPYNINGRIHYDIEECLAMIEAGAVPPDPIAKEKRLPSERRDGITP